MITSNSKVYTTLTVIRPNGETEECVFPTKAVLSQAEFEQIKRKTKEAGRGDVISMQQHGEIKLTDCLAASDNYKKGLRKSMRNSSSDAIGEMSRSGE